jgi:hypothetical protein
LGEGGFVRHESIMQRTMRHVNIIYGLYGCLLCPPVVFPAQAGRTGSMPMPVCCGVFYAPCRCAIAGVLAPVRIRSYLLMCPGQPAIGEVETAAAVGWWNLKGWNGAIGPVSRCRKWGPPQSPCKLARPSLVKMLNSLGYLVFGLRRCAVVMESSNIC